MIRKSLTSCYRGGQLVLRSGEEEIMQQFRGLENHALRILKQLLPGALMLFLYLHSFCSFYGKGKSKAWAIARLLGYSPMRATIVLMLELLACVMLPAGALFLLFRQIPMYAVGLPSLFCIGELIAARQRYRTWHVPEALKERMGGEA